MITVVELAETGLIVGTAFPTQDEGAYTREEAAQRAAAGHAEGAAGGVQGSASYTDSQVKGQTGTAVTDKLGEHHQALSDDSTRHINVADWLGVGAANITGTKLSMNLVIEQYHADYAKLQSKASAESWTQKKLQDEKGKLVRNAQGQITQLRARFDSTQKEVSDGVAAGSPAKNLAQQFGIGQDLPSAPVDQTDLNSPPHDSHAGGGYWSIDNSKGYPAPVPGPWEPWHEKMDPSSSPNLTGASSGLKDMVTPNHPGKGAEPIVTAQEAYKFRIVGRGFDGSPEHVRWVEANGQWYPARWIGYNFEAEHLTYAKSNGDFESLQLPPFGMGQWNPVSINDIYRIANNNPALTMYLPDICGPQTKVGANIAPTNPGVPIMTRPR
ncbi:hypothetical protein [Mycobacteroides abscessus]|uniref:hypothetical protein n=1 Tax=Mycobacteroides abscessus TaxID=36809 RepID=UPI000C268B9E|nr:hypothetical protein [Mycobacteroides abscessus]